MSRQGRNFLGKSISWERQNWANRALLEEGSASWVGVPITCGLGPGFWGAKELGVKAQ